MDKPYIDLLIDKFEKHLGADKSKWVLDQFHGNQSTEEMFTFLWDLEEAHDHLTPTLIPPEKSNTKAEELLVEGNSHYAKSNYDKALELYNASILAAQHPGFQHELTHDKINNNESEIECKEYKTLARGYACRAEVLCCLEQYEESLSDIERASMCGCPEPLRKKLETTKIRCSSAMTKNEAVANDDHCKENKTNIKSIDDMIDKCAEIPCEEWTAKEIMESSTRTRYLPKLLVPHKDIPALSSALKLAYTTTKGRHLIADKDIYPGEVVASEKSYCNGIYFENFHTHCSTCLKECLTPLPCPNCSMVMFCSEECRHKGLSESHLQECNLLPTLATLEKKENCVTYTAFRVILQIPFNKLQEILPILQKEVEENDPIRLGFNKEGIYSSREYRALYHLVMNKHSRSSRELFEITVTAFVLTKLLVIDGQYFRDDLGRPFTPSREDCITVGQLLVRHILNIYCNAFQLSDMKLTKPPIKTVLKVFGEGIFPGLSLFNHSCNPNVRHYNLRDQLVLRATQFIPAGQEVNTTYCGSFYLEDFETRREYLQDSYIDCVCEACLAKWSTIRLLPWAMDIKCPSCSTPVNDAVREPVCSSCKLELGRTYGEDDQRSLVSNWWTMKENLQADEGKIQVILLRKKVGQAVLPQDIKVLSRFLESVAKNVVLPCQSYCYAMDTLFMIFCLQFCSSVKA